MFGKIWFAKKQGLLLWLLNKPLIRLWFRRVLRIKSKEIITEITPSSYSWGEYLSYSKGKWKKHKTTDFRTHNKYSKRIFYAFFPLWAVCHLWDYLVASHIPVLDLGFGDTFYPDPHPETDSVDGYIYWSGGSVSWATVWGDDGTNATASDTTINERPCGIGAGTSTNEWQNMMRGIFLFDTSDIDDDATIDDAVMSLYGTAVQTTATWTITVKVYSSNPASNDELVNADYNRTVFGGTAYCDTGIAETSWDTAGYNDFIFNSAGKTAISKTSITKLGTRDATYDVANSPPAWSNSVLSTVYADFADKTGTATDPKLVVDYTISISAPLGALLIAGFIPEIINLMSLTAPLGSMAIGTFVPTTTLAGGWTRAVKDTSTWTGITKN